MSTRTKPHEPADDPFPPDETTPDGLQGTPSERFVEAASRVFSADKSEVAAREAAEKTARSATAKPHRNKS